MCTTVYMFIPKRPRKCKKVKVALLSFLPYTVSTIHSKTKECSSRAMVLYNT